MTTFDVAASMLKGARTAGRIARAERRRTRTVTAARNTRAIAATIRQLVFTVGGLAAFTIAATDPPHWPAWIVGGASALYLDWLLTE